MRCTACGAELILTNVVPDETGAVGGVEHHTFVCSACHVTERRVVFIKDGRETDSPPVPMQTAARLKRASSVQDEHVVAPGLLSRAVALSQATGTNVGPCGIRVLLFTAKSITKSSSPQRVTSGWRRKCSILATLGGRSARECERCTVQHVTLS